MVGVREVTCDKCGEKKEELVLPRIAVIVAWALLEILFWRLARVQGFLIVAIFALIVYMTHEATVKRCGCKRVWQEQPKPKKVKKKSTKKSTKKKSRG